MPDLWPSQPYLISVHGFLRRYPILETSRLFDQFEVYYGFNHSSFGKFFVMILWYRKKIGGKNLYRVCSYYYSETAPREWQTFFNFFLWYFTKLNHFPLDRFQKWGCFVLEIMAVIFNTFGKDNSGLKQKWDIGKDNFF